MSEHLRAFLADWLEWVDAGAVEGDRFSNGYGLCSNLMWSPTVRNLTHPEKASLLFGLKDLFVADGLDVDYPFGGQDQYERDQDQLSISLNSARVSWVRSKVAELASA